MTDLRAEQYPSLPSVGWDASKAQRMARRAAVDARNEQMPAAAMAAVAVVKGGSIGGMKKEPKKP